jgi:RNA polymerase sigma-70 factor (ECF subfamily)
MRRGPEFTDEVRQRLRQKLLVGTPPRLEAYDGRGPLRAWIRVTTARLAIDLLRERGEELSDDPEAGERIADPAASPELEALRARYLPQFQQALVAALATLTPRQRNLLRTHHADGVSLDALAVTYNVHRATIARWLQSAREELFETTRSKLHEGLGLSGTEFESLMDVLQSQLHISLSGLVPEAD